MGIADKGKKKEEREFDVVDRKRIQLDFTLDAHDRLLELQRKTGARTNAEVVRNALRLYEWFVAQRSNGYQLQLAKEDEIKAVEIIF